MSDYIKREDAISKIYSDFEVDSVSSTRTFGCIANIIDSLSEMPAADVVERPRWIPVTERLPEIKEHHVSDAVLVYLDDGGMAFSELEENIFGQVWFDLERPSPDGESDCTVTHWMPLPQPPKEET